MTITPHQHSFLAIACLAQEHFEFMDHRMSLDGSVSLPDEAAAARVQRYYNDVEADLQAGAASLIESQLGTFVLPEALSVPAAQSFIAQCADDVKKVNRYERQLKSSRKFHEKAPAISIDNTDPDHPRATFRPIRETQVGIIIGAYLSLPDGFRTWARAADLLNRGIPTGDRGGLNDGHVRNALYSGVRHARRLFATNSETLAWSRALLDWAVLEHVWEKARSHQQPRKIDVAGLDALRATGFLEEWRGEIERTVQLRVPSNSGSLAMLQMHIKDLKSLQRKLFPRCAS